MTAASTISVLNRLIPALNRTLPAYLRDARPWTYPGRELALETLLEVGQQQVETAERLSGWIFENHGIPDQGDFPLDFTRYSDLSIDYLVRESLRRQEQLIKLLESCADQLHLVPHAQALVQEALGEAKAHRDMLREAQAPATAGH
ncbi:MAG: hypothetical protein U0935_00770 [Pirellulales bacterium]